MYRPGGFPEYTPEEQKIFDIVQELIRKVFEQHRFQHIWTPAVERTDILLKGGDTVANEIFGLVGLKDYEREEYDRALKSYSLHFDLTVPFARYALDHISDITFPFKRYQIQPVWRGERQQRGRFKEFRQCDVDSIRRAGTNVGSWYGANTIATLQQALQSVVKHFGISQGFVTHLSHVGLVRAWLSDSVENEEKKELVIRLFDDFHKLQRDEFNEKLLNLAGDKISGIILDAIDSGSSDFLSKYEGYDQLHSTLEILEKLGATIVFDPTIVRGLGYYTDIVFETFLDGDKSLGSICSGGGYEKFTEFIDPKNVFSGIGGSIGLSRLMEIVLESQQAQSDRPESYLFVHFQETFDKTLDLYQQFLAEGKVCDIYPVADKFGKQLGYADKSGYSHVVILGENELENGEYQVKELKSGDVESRELSI